MSELNDFNLNKKSTQWNVDADACAGNGQTGDCNLFATHKGNAELQIVSKTLSCGCILYPEEVIEEGEWLLKS